MPVTKVRTMRIEDELWNVALTTAQAERLTLTTVIKYALGAFIVNPQATIAALAQIREGGK